MRFSLEEIEEALELLHLPKMITKQEIKAQYRHLAAKHHPDRGGSEKQMQRINDAYKLLMNYIEEFRYTFDAQELAKQLPEDIHDKRFTES